MTITDIKGTFIKKNEIIVLKNGTSLREIIFKTKQGTILFPKAHGKKINLLNTFQPGDDIELTIQIKPTSKSSHHLIIKDANKL